MEKSKLSRSVGSFEGVYCSGFFISNPSLITAMCLLFEKIHIFNNLEYVIDFSKKYRLSSVRLPPILKNSSVKITPQSPNIKENPLEKLTPKQKETLHNYLLLAASFGVRYSDLVGKVITSELFQKEGVFDVEQIKKGHPGELNKYRFKVNPLIVTTESTDEMGTLISKGAIPIFDTYLPSMKKMNKKILNTKYLASLLAMKSVELVLPRTKPTSGEIILEARKRLKDYLPPFWSSMLKLSIQLKSLIAEETPIKDLYFECQDMIDSTVRPALIDINQELLSEKNKWFHKIISPISKGIKILVGIPSLTPAQLISSGLTLGTNLSYDITKYKHHINTIHQRSGLTFLLELDKLIQKSNSKDTLT